ncbi:MAG: DUF1549 and DUF1553 domain-containing protein, partial [Planctomycetes bacterium]|nr:DUF1549 and DUF1553 domain-containing protein [Planctomycetota bacterium]
MVRLFLLTPLVLSVACAKGAEPIEPPLKDTDRAHWAFQKPLRPEIPRVKNSTWVKTPIDAFILAKLEAKGLTPTKPAERLTLLRRVTFDLTGLPPTPDEIDAFINDNRPDAYERLVDRLLASPHYGERWAQHWLDVVRYAESNGYEGDAERPYAWRYRDYVVRSFNDDKPFDRFLTEQIAGDELAAGKEPRANTDLLIAAGFHRCGPMHAVGGNVDPEETRNEVLTEMVQGIGSAFLGLTMNCARCHDHKFDPISQADYYRLEAFFASTRTKDVDFSLSEERSAHQLKLIGTMARLAPIKAKVAALDAPYQVKVRELKKSRLDPQYLEVLDLKKRTPEQDKLYKDAQTLLKVTWDETLAAMTPADRERRAVLRAEQHAVEAELPIPPSMAWSVFDDGKPPPTHILKRGEVKKKGEIVPPDFPRVVRAGEIKKEGRLTRKDLAAWLTSPDHPLTARVFVNRLWQHHFARGLVGTPNDFGTRGERPTHPELLDFLARELIDNGWKVKPLHRFMVLSATYRQASQAKPNDIDPDNKLLWRMNRHRLEGETLRDAVLAASGSLNRELGGPMVRIPLEPEVYDLIFTEGEPDGLWPVTPDVRQHTRRSLYLFAKRNVRQPLLEAFDQPDRVTSCADRSVSIFAPQALILMNGPFTQTQSRALAAKLLTDHGDKPEALIPAAYRRCFGRTPT